MTPYMAIEHWQVGAWWSQAGCKMVMGMNSQVPRLSRSGSSSPPYSRWRNLFHWFSRCTHWSWCGTQRREIWKRVEETWHPTNNSISEGRRGTHQLQDSYENRRQPGERDSLGSWRELGVSSSCHEHFFFSGMQGFLYFVHPQCSVHLQRGCTFQIIGIPALRQKKSVTEWGFLLVCFYF